MKKKITENIKNNIKKNLLFFIGVIIGVLLTSTTVYAAILYQSSEVGYTGTRSGLTSTDVQSAIDELNTLIKKITTVAPTPDPSVPNFVLNYLEDDNKTIIESYVYEFESGMTWNEFVELDSMNNQKFALDASNVYYIATGLYVRTSSGTMVKRTDTVSSTTYIMSNDLCCFDPDTLITVDLEGNTKKIKDIEVGDTIVVENINTKEKHLTTVLKDASEHPITYDMTILTLEDGTKLKFNSYHPIYTTEGYKSVTNYND